MTDPLLVTRIQHPDELQDDLRAAFTEWSERKGTFAEGVVRGLTLAMAMVEAHTFSHWEES